MATLRKNYAASLRAAGRAAEADALEARTASTAPEAALRSAVVSRHPLSGRSRRRSAPEAPLVAVRWVLPIADRISVSESMTGSLSDRPPPRPLPLGGGITHWPADISSPPHGRGLRGGRSKIIVSFKRARRKPDRNAYTARTARLIHPTSTLDRGPAHANHGSLAGDVIRTRADDVTERADVVPPATPFVPARSSFVRSRRPSFPPRRSFVTACRDFDPVRAGDVCVRADIDQRA